MTLVAGNARIGVGLMAIGLRRAVCVIRGGAVAGVTCQTARPPGRRSIVLNRPGGNRRTVTMAVCVGTVAVTVARLGSAVVSAIAVIRIKQHVNGAVGMIQLLPGASHCVALVTVAKCGPCIPLMAKRTFPHLTRYVEGV